MPAPQRHREKLLDAIYDAALDPSLWNGFLHRLTHSMPGSRGTFVFHDPVSQTGEMSPISSRLDPEWTESYTRYYASINPWLKNIERRPIGRATPAEFMCPADELLRTEFYADFLRPQELSTGVGVTILQDGGRFMAVSALFPKLSDHTQRRYVDQLQSLVPHLQRAARVNRQLAHSNFRWQAAEQTLNRLAVGVVLVTSRLSVVFANRSAEVVLAKADGISIARSGRLVLADPTAAAQLVRCMRQPDNGGNGVLAVRRPSGERPFTLMIAPVQRAARPLEFGQAAAMVFIRDPGERGNVAPEALAELFDLSRAEARLVRMLLDGHRLDDAAELLHVSHNTVKSQLKTIFEKLGCSRQSELVRLVGASVINFTR